MMATSENGSHSNVPSPDDTGDRHKELFAEVGPQKHLGLWTLFPALLIFLFCISLPTVMLWYLLSRPAVSPAAGDMHLFNGAIIVVEGSRQSSTVSDGDQAQTSTLYGLAFATTINHIYSITVPLLMGLLAYRVAAKWLRSLSALDGEKSPETALLTPLQYGIMLKIYGSSNLFTLLQSGRYLYRQRWTGILKSPVVSSFAALAVVLLLSHAISLADLWLHVVSGTVIYSSVSPVNDLASMPYGTTINKTICPYPGYGQISASVTDPEEALTPGAIPPGQNCASYDNVFVSSWPPGPGWGNIIDPSILAASVSASNNMSDFRTSIIIESDNIAVLVPPSISSSNGLYNFSASTYGLSMSCETPNCGRYQSGPPEGVDGGPFGCTEFIPAYNASLYNLTSFLYDPTTMAQQPNWSNGTGVNPFGFFIELPFDNNPYHDASGEDARNATNGQPGWYFGTWPGSVVYLTQCTVTSYDVLLANANNTYTIANASLTDFNTTSALSTGFLSWMASTYLLPQIQNVMSSETTSVNFSSMVQAQMMLRALALNAGILTAVPVNASTVSTTRIASRYPIAPVATFVALLYAYGLLALVVVAWVCFLRSDSVVVHSDKGTQQQSVLQMVQVRLTDPLATVAESFAQPAPSSSAPSELSEDWRRTLETDSLDMFGPDDQGEIAPQISRTASGNVQFGLRRRYAMLGIDDVDAENSEV